MSTATRLDHLCWLKIGSGLGLCFNEERGVFQINVSHDDVLGDDADPRWDGLLCLLSSEPDAIPYCNRVEIA